MIQFNFDKQCYGCGLCAAVCPTRAIEMQMNREGFSIPVIHEENCIQCEKCEKMCVRINSEHPGIELAQQNIYAYYLLDMQQRIKSTSGGGFYALAKNIIKDNGIVCGCVWNENMDAVIIATDKMADVERMRGSKYVQSTIDCYEKITVALKAKRKVLFSGVPCQVAAVQKYCANHPNLITVALFCEGTASRKAWHKYVNQLEEEQGSKLIGATHRKTGKYGWFSPMSEYVFANSKRIEELSFTLDRYVHNMIYGYFTCNACYQCEYKGNRSTADLLIGDYWGISKDLMRATKNKGCSIVIVNTEKGKALFNQTLSDSAYKKITLEMAAQRNPPLLHVAGKNGLRDEFLHALESMSFQEVVDQYCNMNTPKVKIQRVLHTLGLAGVAKRILRR